MFVLLTKYNYTGKSRRKRWTGHVAHMGEMRNAHILTGKHSQKRPHGRYRY
jgi:hypothetical protein